MEIFFGRLGRKGWRMLSEKALRKYCRFCALHKSCVFFLTELMVLDCLLSPFYWKSSRCGVCLAKNT